MASGVTAAVADAAPRRRVIRWVVLALIAIAVVLVVWTLIAALAAKSRLSAARTDLNNLRKYTNVNRSDVEARLQRDLSRTRQARGWLHQFGPTVVGAVPLFGRSVVAERTVADASAAAVESGLAAAHDTDNLGTAGHVNLTALARAHDDLQAHAALMRKPLRRLASLRTSLTPGPVGHGVHLAQDALLGLDTDLQRAADFTDALGGILGANGPRTVLVALQNNAELRGTGGLISTYALGTARDGRLDLGKFQDVDRIAATPRTAKPVPAPVVFHAHYGPYLADTTLWKDVNFDPDVPTSAEVLSEVAAATIKKRPDVIIMLDVPAMAQIVTVTGPITLTNGLRLTGAQLTSALLVDAYSTHADTLAGQTERRLQLEDAASRSVHRLTSAHPSLQLVRTLANLAAGRHISIWSARPTEEQLLETSEVSGSVNPGGHDIAMVSLTNLGDSLAHTLGAIGNGNKLDYYARRNLDVEVNIGARSARVVETFTLRNETPLGLHGKPLPRYVAGPEHPGRLHELIAFSLAANANITSFTRNGQIQLATFDNENGARRVSFVYDLQRGQQATWMLSYNVPLDHGTYQLDVIPQPLAQPATLRVAVTADPGRQLDWLPGEGPRPKGGVVDTGPRPWTTVTHIAVRLHHRHGWDAIRHAISDFFTKPVS